MIFWIWTYRNVGSYQCYGGSCCLFFLLWSWREKVLL